MKKIKMIHENSKIEVCSSGDFYLVRRQGNIWLQYCVPIDNPTQFRFSDYVDVKHIPETRRATEHESNYDEHGNVQYVIWRNGDFDVPILEEDLEPRVQEILEQTYKVI